MIIYNPPHPGEVLKEMYLEPLGLTVTNSAKALGISRQTLSEIINCRTGITAAMAMKLAKAFKTTPEMWINLQTKYDLWQVKDLNLRVVKCLVPRTRKNKAA